MLRTMSLVFVLLGQIVLSELSVRLFETWMLYRYVCMCYECCVFGMGRFV